MKLLVFLLMLSTMVFLFGLRLWSGIVFGDLFFAFIKRRLKLKPGFPFIPFDQTNYALGACLFLEPTLNLGAKFWLTLFVLTFINFILSLTELGII